MRNIIYLIGFFFVASCAVNVDQDIKNIERILDVKLNDGFEIKNEKYDYGVGNSIKSFDIIFTEAAFNLFFNKVKNKFEKIDKNIIKDIKIKNDYYKNIDLGDTRIHMAINLSRKTLHYAIVDL